MFPMLTFLYEFNCSSNFHPNFSRIKELNYIVNFGIATLKKMVDQKLFRNSKPKKLLQQLNSDAFFSPLFSLFLS